MLRITVDSGRKYGLPLSLARRLLTFGWVRGRSEGTDVNSARWSVSPVRVASLGPSAKVRCGLFGAGQGVELGFEGLVVLALDLEFGLEFFHQEIEARDFGAELQ